MSTYSTIEWWTCPYWSRWICSFLLGFFIYPFAHKEVVELTVNPKTKDESFGVNLASDDSIRCTYSQEAVDSVSSTAAKAFNNNVNSSQLKLCGTYITHINHVPVFSTAQTQTQL